MENEQCIFERRETNGDKERACFGACAGVKCSPIYAGVIASLVPEDEKGLASVAQNSHKRELS